MRIVQATFGVFHQFDLARELHRRGHLERIYSTYPWRRLQREGVPHSLVETYPWVHTAELLLGQRNLLTPRAAEFLSYRNATTFDEWTYKRIPECEAIVALAGAALTTGAKVQKRGGKFLCDTGSSHRRFQANILREEHQRWKQEYIPDGERAIARDELIYGRADGITVASTFVARSFIQMGISAHKIHTIPYGVQLERFSRTTPPPDIRERFEVLFAGQVNLRKGFPYLLQAFARLSHPNKRLRVAGRMVPEFAGVIKNLPQNSVEFLGALPQGELAAVMGSSHILVLPSIEDGFGLVMGQAMACGCPVLATTNTGAENLFTDGKEGFIVAIREVEALASRLQLMVDEPGLSNRMSEAALARVRLLGGWTEYGDRWEALLRRLTGSQ